MKKIVCVLLLVLSSCASQTNSRNLTLGTIQRDIKEGISSVEVIEILGSPNIISSNEKYKEVWIYDKISTEESKVSGAAIGFIPHLLAGISGSKRSSSQRTLTLILKFDDALVLRDVKYHVSRF